MSKKMFHLRKESGELDVFEAANYFAADHYHHQVSCHNNNNNGLNFSHKLNRDACNNQAWRSTARISLDMPLNIPHSSTSFGTTLPSKPAQKEKSKQPSSPGGKLASFLNSLFNQTISSKKKNKSKSKSKENENQHQSRTGWVKRRRSSISELYARSFSNTTTQEASGFRTPPPYNYKTAENSKLRFNGVHRWADEYPSEEKGVRNKFDCDDDDADSDSSSDLFDLPNSELLDYYSSSGLPVYETTQIGINASGGAPISAAVN